MPHEAGGAESQEGFGTVELGQAPVCEDILNDMRRRLVREGDWGDDATRSRGSYVASMCGYEAAGRIGEYTHSERTRIRWTTALGSTTSHSP
jgi:hypothetical protein